MATIQIKTEKQKLALDRLKRIEGQVRGLQKMIEEDRYCVDVLHQLGAVEGALRAVGDLMFQNYLETCVTRQIRTQPKDELYQEIMEVVRKYRG